MRRVTKLGSVLALSTMILGVSSQTRAVQFSDGTVAFAHPPRLVKTVATNSDVSVWGATYYFTIAVPEKAGEPLQKVTIQQREGLDKDLNYELKRSSAFEGEFYRRRGEPIQLGEVTFDRDSQTVTVIFDPPVMPGKTVTVGLQPYSNPDTSGIYQFGVTAFPRGEKTRGQFLGFGRLTFYRGWNF
jgi:hypothetical protein